MAIEFQDLPSPPGLPLLGNMHQVRFPQLHLWLEHQSRECGDVFRVKLGPLHLTAVAKPELIQSILKSRPGLFRRGSKLDKVMQEENIHGVFNAEGDAWKQHRRIVTRGLDIKHQEAFYPSMVNIADRLLRKMNTAASLQMPYNVSEDLLRFTVDVTTSLAFGIDMNTLEQDGNVIQDHMEKIFPTIFHRINSPIPWYKFFPSRREREFRVAIKAIETYVHEFIQTGRKRLQDHPELAERPDNILDALLTATQDESQFTEKEIRSNLLTLLMAGEDTTAHSLAWAIYLLALHPEIQEHMHDEAKRVLVNGNLLRDYRQVDALPYVTAVIHETLRLKGVAPLMIVEPLEDVTLENYRFRKGSRIVLLTRAAGIQESNFSFAGEMRPERWLDANNSGCPVHRIQAFMPFGFGPRLCPGKNLAMLEMKLVLSMIAKSFHLQLETPPEQVRERMAFTMMPEKFEVKLIIR